MSLALPYFSLIVLAALMHAAWNAVIKTAPNGLISMALLNFVGGVFGAVILTTVNFPDSDSLPYILLSAVFHTLYSCFIVMAYDLGDLSLVYPIARGSGPVMVALLSWPLVGEMLSPQDWIGVILVSIGVTAISFRSKAKVGASSKPILLSLVTGGCIAGYTIIDGIGARMSSSPIGYVALLTIFFSIPLMIVCCITRYKETISFVEKYWKRICISGLMAIASYGITLWVMSKVSIALVATVREISVVFAAMIGAILLGEAFGILRIAAAIAVVLGIFLIQG